jgi:hypothetical protein
VFQDPFCCKELAAVKKIQTAGNVKPTSATGYHWLVRSRKSETVRC